MTNREIMRSALDKHTIKELMENGFVGKYPHYRRIFDHHVELISFQTNKYGGSFTVELSVVFPNAENTNYHPYAEKSKTEYMIDGTNVRYRLPGLFDGWFYYRDVYVKRSLFMGRIYHDVPEKEAANFSAPKGYRLIQKFDETAAIAICKEINLQLVKAFEWLSNIEKKWK